jgi:phosphoribosylamine--glycine ligase/phosphoribosylformylglycinamidine cyclo-ligase
VVAGDVLIGLTSSGVHSNGFSLVRKIISSQNLSYNSPCPWDARSETIGRALLEPTRIYIKQVLPSLKRIKAMSHITGGGFIDNIPRVLPKGLGAEVRSNAWELPPVFKWLMKAGNVEAMEMARTFNCGVGLVLIVNESEVDQLMEELRGRGGSQEAQVARIGTVVEGAGVRMLGMDSWC